MYLYVLKTAEWRVWLFACGYKQTLSNIKYGTPHKSDLLLLTSSLRSSGSGVFSVCGVCGDAVQATRGCDGLENMLFHDLLIGPWGLRHGGEMYSVIQSKCILST